MTGREWGGGGLWDAAGASRWIGKACLALQRHVARQLGDLVADGENSLTIEPQSITLSILGSLSTSVVLSKARLHSKIFVFDFCDVWSCFWVVEYDFYVWIMIST